MTRSLKQNDYYHKVVVPLVREGFYDIGYNVSKFETHNTLKSKFLKVEIIDETDWTYRTEEGSTRTLTTKEFQEFISRIQQWAAEYLNIYVPDPNEQL